ncbi:hypothetical protein GQ55_7G275600 [Panicum hallii var. hallii]|uniref:Uncharacterized protein n=1 Tax=Panicum hallii var. hallii TaxID=1504633 RepID=A0A2T7CZR7_9POAL|nr:hypothetical protein GQ55_7G275600 [Panicum hallii var. hallii]
MVFLVQILLAVHGNRYLIACYLVYWVKELSSLALDDEINRRKEETSQLESVVRERTAQMAALVGELELLQKVNVADDESVMKANTNVDVLEKQIERLGSDLEDQVRKGESLEARATEAEKNWHEFSHKLEHAENINVEQRKKIQDLGGRLQIAQDKLSDLEKEAKLNAEELAKVHGMWLPHWLAARVVRCQEVASAKWQAHGKPVLGPLMQKVAEKSTYAQRLMEPHLQKAQNVGSWCLHFFHRKKWVPIAKNHLTSLRNTTTVYTSAVYRVCRDAIQPCTVKAREFAGHYWQECKAFSQPYISCIVALSEPHLSRANVALEPYMEPVTSGCRSLASLASEYHHQVQNGVEGFLEDTRLLTPLPADKLAWLTASALFALPVLSIYKILSATIRPFLGVLFCSKKNQAKKRQRQQPQEQAQSRQVEK